MAIIRPDSGTSPAGGTSDKRLSDKTIQILNKQIKVEADAAQIYYAMSEWCENTGYFGSASLLERHSSEERGHMSRVYKYLSDRDVLPVTPEIAAPKKQIFKGLPELFNAAYEHEKFVTSTYNDIAILCMEEKDFMTFNFALRFLKEQMEEESKFKGFIDEINTMGGDKKDLYLFDQRLKDGGMTKECCG